MLGLESFDPQTAVGLWGQQSVVSPKLANEGTLMTL